MRTFVIPVRDLTSAGAEIQFPVPRQWVEEALQGCDLRAVADGRMVVRVSTSGRNVVVRGIVEVSLAAVCVRCLEPAVLEVDAELERLFVPRAGADPPLGPPRGSRELAEEEAEEETDDVDSYDGVQVVLDDVVREEILLGVPMNPLCREDCPGIGERRAEVPSQGAPASPAPTVSRKKE